VRNTVAATCCLLFSLAAATLAQAQKVPPAVVVHPDVCPFEGCTYRNWIAVQEVPLYDQPQGQVVSSVKKDESVQALTGVIYAHPVPFRLTQPDQANQLPKGTLVYALHPVGEGIWQVWWNGRFLAADISSMGFDGKGIDYQWWVKVRTQSGNIRWVRVDLRSMQFRNMDRFGSDWYGIGTRREVAAFVIPFGQLETTEWRTAPDAIY
jgi:hypothetical protein